MGHIFHVDTVHAYSVWVSIWYFHSVLKVEVDERISNVQYNIKRHTFKIKVKKKRRLRCFQNSGFNYVHHTSANGCLGQGDIFK